MNRLHVGIENEKLVAIAPPAGAARNPDGLAHGGSQMWLPSRIKRSTGCGGVAAANMLAYYLLQRNGGLFRKIRAEDYLALHKRCFPGLLGGFFPFAWLFTFVVKRLFRRHGLAARCHDISTLSCDTERARAELKAALYGGNPVALQSWLPHSKNVRGWHWVTVTAMDITGSSTLLHVSSWGMDYTYDLSLVWRGKASMVWFETE